MKFLAASALLAAASATAGVGSANTAAPKYQVTVSDARSAANAVGVAAPLKTDKSAPYYYNTGAVTVKVDFTDYATAQASASAAAVIVDAAASGGSHVALAKGASDPVGSNCASGSTTSCRTFTYTLTNVEDADTLVLPAGAFKRTGDLVATTQAVTITFTKGANAFAGVTAAASNKIATSTAAIGADYWYYIPSSLFANVNGELEITGGSASVAGLSVVPGKSGRAAIAGRMTAMPSAVTQTGCWSNAPQVVFTLNARDSSGATTTSTLCVGVEAAPASATSAALGTTPIAYSEQGAAVKFFASTPASVGLATTAYAYVESPDTYAATEVIAGGDAASAQVTGSATLIGATKTGVAAVGDLDGLTYANTNQAAKGSSALVKRTARVVLTKAADAGFTGATDVVLAVGSRPINFAVDNAAPTATSAGSFLVASGAAPTAVTFTEGAATEKLLFSDVVIADNDDSDVRYATVTITNNYKKGLDLLGLQGFAATMGVTATFSAEKGQLTLSPPAGAQSVPKATMQTALQAVAWYPAEADNVNGRDMPSGHLIRTIEVTVVDNAASGLAAAAASVTKVGSLDINAVADAPTLVAGKAYNAGGALSSTDPFANVLADAVAAAGATHFNQPKHTIIVPSTAVTGDVITGSFPVNFSKVSDGVYLGGALSYLDANTVTPSVAYAAGTNTEYSATAAAGKYTAVANLANNRVDYSFTYAAASLGEKDGKLTIDGTDLPFYIDIRQRKCPFGTFTAATDYPDASLCTTAATHSYASGTASTFNMNVGAAGTVATARGNVQLALPAAAAAANVAITAQPASAANLPPLAPLEGVQGDLAVSFGPDGTTFTAGSEPTVCVNVGSVPAGKKAYLAVSSQANGKFGAWETLSAVTAAPASASVLCGKLPHFSVVAPVFVAAETLTASTSTANTADKLFQMGASCPNACSGKGFCREHGQCSCFDGFTGYDCSLRTCPTDQSWDLPADGSVTHNEAECSARGACDRKAGVCACFPGFEGAACQRVSCPGDCNGHGKCRKASELPTVAAGFANQWEAERVQVCQCDAGYQGYDCSERICPFGDDPETVCKDSLRQKQKVTIDFGTVPSTATSAAWTNLGANDELTLGFKTRANHVLNTPTVGDLWSATTSDLADNLKKALTSLPEFAVSDVSVTATRASSTASKVDLDFEFTGSSLQWNMAGYPGFTYSSAVAGNTVSGDQNKFMCDLQGATEFINGCVGQGCRPAHKQARLYEETVVAGSSFAALNPNSVLQQVASNGAVDFSTPGVWGMEVVVTVNSDGTAASYKYEVNAYGQSYGTPSEETPLPPTADARKNVPIAHGLFIDFSGVPAAGTHQMVFAWRLPKCSVTVTQNAEEQFESAECSKRGSCDRKTGTCKCYPGYSGYNCGAQQIAL